MHLLIRLLDSTVGQKVITAATGLGLVVFVFVHMIGNLQIYAGQDVLNTYAEQLKSLGPLAWIARIGLLVLVSLHIVLTIRLTIRNRSARNGKYAIVKSKVATTSSRYMIVSGSVILGFIIFHLLHFTFGLVQPASYQLMDSEGRHDVYQMMVSGFRHWGIAGFYIVAMFFLFSHLSHATFSLFQTLGVNVGGNDTRVKSLAWYISLAVVFGFVSIPIAVLVGWVS